MNPAPQVLLFDDAPRLAGRVRDELEDRGFATRTHADGFAADGGLFGGADLAVLVLDQQDSLKQADEVLTLLEGLTKANVPTLVWGMSTQAGALKAPMLDCVSPDASLEEVMARLAALGRYGPMIRQMEREISNLERVGQQLNRYFTEIDQELRLAGRLQSDFLPRSLPQLAPYTFATVYRPASWVSGDMYDVFRIDEHNIGVFMTDAMGHGIAAGLLTMFLRQALVAKHITGRSYRIVSPAEVMRSLNDCLIRRQLPNCQFVTGVYAIFDTESLVLRFARGGHPHPIHVDRDGQARVLSVPGGLLGVPDIPVDFGEHRLRLDPGDKVYFYTDGVEDVFVAPAKDADEPIRFTEQFQSWAHLGVHAFMRELVSHLDQAEGSLHPADDITVVAVEVAEQTHDAV